MDRVKRVLGMLGARRGWAAAAFLAVCAVGAWSTIGASRIESPPQLQLTAVKLPIPRTERPQAPAALQQELETLVADYGEAVGVAVTDVRSGWTAGVDVDSPYPQQSVSKLWVALAVLKAVDEGRLDLDGWVTLTHSDRSVFFQPVAYNIGPAGYTTQIASLLRRALVESDNAANDRLMLEAGGPDAVTSVIGDMGLEGVSVGSYERDLQALIAGLSWQPEYGIGWNFQAARERLPRDVREQALETYLLNPLDGATPAGIARALAALHRGELLSEPSTALMIDLMEKARTGPRRLKGGLPPGWTIAHKTGTGQDYQGASVGINDVGLLTAPDGRTYAVAVLMRRTRQPVPARLALMQKVTRAVAAEWERGRLEPPPAGESMAADLPPLSADRGVGF